MQTPRFPVPARCAAHGATHGAARDVLPLAPRGAAGRVRHITLAAVVVGASLATPASAFEDDTLVIWIGENKAPDAMRAAVAPFVEDPGIAVRIEEVEPLPDKFQQAAATGDGPDLVLYAHDRFGEWAAGGLIAPVEPGAGFTDGVLDTAVWR